MGISNRELKGDSTRHTGAFSSFLSISNRELKAYLGAVLVLVAVLNAASQIEN